MCLTLTKQKESQQTIKVIGRRFELCINLWSLLGFLLAEDLYISFWVQYSSTCNVLSLLLIIFYVPTSYRINKMYAHLFADRSKGTKKHQ